LRIIALYNIKGGVGKTAACVNLAYLASREGKPVLLCDLDPQGAASFYLRIKPSKKYRAKYLLKSRAKVTKNIKGTDFENLDLLPAALSYRKLDLLLGGIKRSKDRLQEVLQNLQNEYHYIFIDCPPNITLVSENVFVAAQFLLVPMIPTTLSMLSYQRLSRFLEKHHYEAGKLFAFFSMVEQRKKLHQQIISQSTGSKLPFLQTQIPYSAEVEKMGLFRKPIVECRPNAKASQAYERLWQELKPFLKGNQRLKQIN
jgi:chromosome partitioning protein